MQNQNRSPDQNGAPHSFDGLEIFQALLDLIPDPISVKDCAGKYVWGNAAKLKEMGVKDLKELVGKTAFDFFGREMAHAFTVDEEHVLQTGQTIINRREEIAEPNGNTRWHLTSKVPWRDSEGTVIGLMTVSHDITGRMEVESKLQEERNLLRTLIDHLPDCIYAKDEQGRKVMTNPSDLKNLGCATEAEALGKTDFDFFPKEIAEQFTAAEQTVLKEGKPLINHRRRKSAAPTANGAGC